MSANAPADPPTGIAWRPPRNVEYKDQMFYGPAEVQLVSETVPNGKGGQWRNVAMVTATDTPNIIGRVDVRHAAPLYRELAAGRIAVVPYLEWQKFNLKEIWLGIDVFGSAAAGAHLSGAYVHTNI